MNHKYFFAFSLCAIAFVLSPLEATYVYKAGRLINTKEAAWMSVQDHYAAAMSAYEKKNWVEVVRHCNIVLANFPESAFAEEAIFYQAVGYFGLKDYDVANKNFTKYLTKNAAPKHFEEAISYKYKIAEKFEAGAKKHVMGFQSLPQWLPAKEEALSIYDEVITALPNHELAAKALFGKANLQLLNNDYTDAIETAQILIRRFPKNPLAPKSYLLISQAYYSQVKDEFNDPDLLDLAEINLKRYAQDFPSDERIKEAKEHFASMQELYANQLLQIGNFYQKTKKSKAADLYFTKILNKYPDTKVAQEVRKKYKQLAQALEKNSKQENSDLAVKESPIESER